jgi:nucleoside-diphosphate-sugar epimerase
MKITLTGAAGRLGSHVCRALVEAGHTVRGVDQSTRLDLPIPIEVVNLLDRERCYGLVEGADAIVHLANHPTENGRDKQRILNENITMNTNVFQAAYELGVKNIVFSSSIQAIGGGRKDGEEHFPTLAYLPIDGDIPAKPTNIYGASKQLSEELLRYYARECGLNCIALRFPYISDGIPGPRRPDRPLYLERLNEGWSYLSLDDASRLILAILETGLTGFRIYCPAARTNRMGRPVGPLIEQFYANIPLKKPLETLDSFFDISQITQETGWEPQDEVELNPN